MSTRCTLTHAHKLQAILKHSRRHLFNGCTVECLQLLGDSELVTNSMQTSGIDYVELRYPDVYIHILSTVLLCSLYDIILTHALRQRIPHVSRQQCLRTLLAMQNLMRQAFIQEKRTKNTGQASSHISKGSCLSTMGGGQVTNTHTANHSTTSTDRFRSSRPHRDEKRLHSTLRRQRQPCHGINSEPHHTVRLSAPPHSQIVIVVQGCNTQVLQWQHVDPENSAIYRGALGVVLGAC